VLLMAGILLLAGEFMLLFDGVGAGADRCACTGALRSTFLDGEGVLYSIFLLLLGGVLLSTRIGCVASCLVKDELFLTALLLLLAGASAVLTVCMPCAPFTVVPSVVLTAFPFLRTVFMFELPTLFTLDEFENEFRDDSKLRVPLEPALFCSSVYLLLTLLFLLEKEVLGCCLSYAFCLLLLYIVAARELLLLLAYT
jgi:hypothetical protein